VLLPGAMFLLDWSEYLVNIMTKSWASAEISVVVEIPELFEVLPVVKYRIKYF
jgi:hypothetical protein